mgnify:CR=1 FL=1
MRLDTKRGLVNGVNPSIALLFTRGLAAQNGRVVQHQQLCRLCWTVLGGKDGVQRDVAFHLPNLPSTKQSRHRAKAAIKKKRGGGVHFHFTHSHPRTYARLPTHSFSPSQAQGKKGRRCHSAHPLNSLKWTYNLWLKNEAPTVADVVPLNSFRTYRTTSDVLPTPEQKERVLGRGCFPACLPPPH